MNIAVQISEVDGQPKPILKSRFSCVEPCVTAVAVCLANIPVCSPHCSGQNRWHYSFVSGCFVLWLDQSLSMLSGLKWTRMLRSLKIFLTFPDVPVVYRMTMLLCRFSVSSLWFVCEFATGVVSLLFSEDFSSLNEMASFIIILIPSFVSVLAFTNANYHQRPLTAAFTKSAQYIL